MIRVWDALDELEDLMTNAVAFDYGSLPETRTRLAARETAKLVKRLLQQSSVAMVDIGRKLLVLRQSMSGPQFRAWLQAEFAWSPAASSLSIRSAERFGDCRRLERVHPLALFALCGSKVSKETVAEALAIVNGGELLTGKRAREIAAAYAN